MIKSHKNLLLSSLSYVLLIVFANLPFLSIFNQHVVVAFFSVLGLVFGIKGLRKEGKFGSIAMILIGIILVIYVAIAAFVEKICTGGGC